MTAIPSNAKGLNPRDNLVRSVLLMQSVCAPTVAVAANSAKGTPLVSSFVGILGFQRSFQVSQEGSRIKVRAEIPYSPKIFGSLGDLKKSLLPIKNTAAPTWAGAAANGTVDEESLENLIYSAALSVADGLIAGESLQIRTIIDPANRSLVEIVGDFTYSLSTLTAMQPPVGPPQ